MQPTKLGKYTLYESLGRGGYGTVYRAREDVLEVIRAIKVLHPTLDADLSFIERFQNEAQVAARLDHDHIVPVYELAEEQGRYYLAMKYLPGGSLKDLLEKQGTLPYGRALQITKQIASALDYAHQQGLVHRDVKPGNILFDADGSARLADFGFSKAMQSASSASFSATGGMIGTPQYMAPEIWSGKGATPATDVYSLASVLGEMLTGRAMFAGESPPEIMTRHVLYGPQLPERWPGDVPDGFQAVMLHALARQPEDRYQTPLEFMKALELLEEQAITPVQAVEVKGEALGREEDSSLQQREERVEQTAPVDGDSAKKAAEQAAQAQPGGLSEMMNGSMSSVPCPAAALGGEAMPGEKAPRLAATLRGEATPGDWRRVRENEKALCPAAALRGEAMPGEKAPLPEGEAGVRAINETPPPAAALGGEAMPSAKSGGRVDNKTPLPAATLRGEAKPGDWRRVRVKPNLPFFISLGLIGLVGVVIVAAILLSNMNNPPQQMAVLQANTNTATSPNPTNTSVPTVTKTVEPTTTDQMKPTPTQTISPSPTSTRGPTTFTGPTPPATAYLGDKWLSSKDDMLLAYIPAGEFKMGSDEGYDDEKPVHAVYLDAFWMDTTEVTNGQYAKCVEEKICKIPTASSWYRKMYFIDEQYKDHPVVSISWYEANDYCTWAGRRLPTEAEWEKAARGGLEGKAYPWGDEDPICELGAANGANIDGCNYGDAIKVASFGANKYGLHDMLGNVWEWVFDWFAEDYYASSPANNPIGPVETGSRVIRGVAWDYDLLWSRTFLRLRLYPITIFDDVGFRCSY